MLWRTFPIVLVLALGLLACSDGSSGAGGGAGAGNGDTSSGITPSALPEPVMVERLSDADYDALTAEEKYAMTNKVLGTLFKGIPAEDFFDLRNGLSPLASSRSDSMACS